MLIFHLKCAYTEKLAKVWIDLFHAGTGVLIDCTMVLVVCF
jgi:hypothetical protein